MAIKALISILCVLFLIYIKFVVVHARGWEYKTVQRRAEGPLHRNKINKCGGGQMLLCACVCVCVCVCGGVCVCVCVCVCARARARVSMCEKHSIADPLKWIIWTFVPLNQSL